MLAVDELKKWMDAVRESPVVPGPGNDCIRVHVSDRTGCEDVLDQLETRGCARVRLSFASDDATYNLGRKNLQRSEYLKTNRRMLESIGKRALKSFFVNSYEGDAYQRLVMLIGIGPDPGGASSPSVP